LLRLHKNNPYVNLLRVSIFISFFVKKLCSVLFILLITDSASMD
jgi:hypothetical protein